VGAGAHHAVEGVQRAQGLVQLGCLLPGIGVNPRCLHARTGFDFGGGHAGIGLLDTGIARGIGADGGGLFIAAGGAFGGNGVAFGPHARHGGIQRDGGQGQAFQPDIHHAHAITFQQLRCQLLAQLLFQLADAQLAAVGIHQIARAKRLLPVSMAEPAKVAICRAASSGWFVPRAENG
jgi:hypothetical protein